jgi:general secretion pathway protein I
MTRRRRSARGFTLVEAVVALAVVAMAAVAAERLLARSARTVAAERAAVRAQLAAQALLAEARESPLPLGTSAGTAQPDVRFEREVRATEHPALREVRVRTQAGDDPGASCELVEVVRAPRTR